ncbi:hypothetical protein KVR01_000606 [Diaporthe batatas]|uniref:uncharacterized protein n=1 Tax=Diaporthe batatas TaxID=748121 RepID=UPI001D055987|nr:uncharacterized protein KVR01_000606 [Diaporthe batatas]KAG8169861.1 hypothetical protein KVR01_000606 [Diaporthe batatas]
MSASSDSVSVHVKITIKPSCTESFLKVLKPTLDATVAEPLNTFIELYRLEKEPGVFRLVENWDATADYLRNTQTKKEYYQSYYAAIQPMLLKAPEVEIFDRMPGNHWVGIKKEAYPDKA